MSEPTCPFCGDGMASVGTLNHIECVAALRSQLQAKTEDAERWEGIARRVAAVAASAMPLAMTMAIRMGMTEMDATPEQIEKELQEAIIFYDAARKDAK